MIGTVARHLADRGHQVLALDTDTMPGLAYSIGIAGLSEARLPAGLAQMVEGKGWRMIRKGSGAGRLVDTYAVVGPSGIRYLELGKLPGRVEPTVTVAFRHVMEGFRRPGWTVLADLAAGTRQAMFGWARFATTRVVVADSSAKSLITARRLLPVATHLVANRVRNADDLEAIKAATPLPLLGVIPYDEAVVEAERRGAAVIDSAPDAPAVRAAAELARRLEEMSS